jgi:hypothetical protein
MKLKEYLLDQHAPPEIQEKVKELFAAIDKWDKYHYDPDNGWHYSECCYEDVIDELKAILD